MMLIIPLFKAFLAICLFRKGPQDLPSSALLFKLCLLAYALSGLLVLQFDLSLANALLLVLLDIALLISLIFVALQILGHGNRLLQTLTACVGAGIILNLVALPLSYWDATTTTALQTDEPVFGVSALLSMLLLLWNLVIVAHILRHAFSVAFPVGVLYALSYWIIFLAFAYMMLPPAL